MQHVRKEDDRFLHGRGHEGVKPIRSSPNFPGFQGADFPVLAVGKVRYVGEAVAMAVAEKPAAAEDLLQEIEVEYEPLDTVMDMKRALRDDDDGGRRLPRRRVSRGPRSRAGWMLCGRSALSKPARSRYRS